MFQHVSEDGDVGYFNLFFPQDRHDGIREFLRLKAVEFSSAVGECETLEPIGDDLFDVGGGFFIGLHYGADLDLIHADSPKYRCGA